MESPPSRNTDFDAIQRILRRQIESSGASYTVTAGESAKVIYNGVDLTRYIRGNQMTGSPVPAQVAQVIVDVAGEVSFVNKERETPVCFVGDNDIAVVILEALKKLRITTATKDSKKTLTKATGQYRIVVTRT